MAIQIDSRVDELTPGLKLELERKLGRMFRKASDAIRKISVSIANVKNREGAIIKQCRLILSLAGAPTVMVIARKKTLESAFENALDRASRALAHRKQFEPALQLQPAIRFGGSGVRRAALKGFRLNS